MEMTSFVPFALLGAAVLLLIIFFYYVPFLLWISAKVSGVNISLIQLFLMRIRKVPPYIITRAMIEAHKAGLKTLTRDELEAHYLAGGHVKANIDLPFQMATAIDLAGRDVFEAVQMSVNPKVINTPPVTAVAKDGIQLIAKARVTVRANIKQLVGGAGEETVLARVGEGIVSSIGSSESHKSVLENPDSISKLVLRKGLDAGTAFEILSIDIADIDIGKNIGAYLQMDQAQADKNIAQAKAEERRAMAVAVEQEMKAKAQEARAKVIEAEAEVPKAMAEAFRSGNLGIMDYYKMKNIEADTTMREAIAKPITTPFFDTKECEVASREFHTITGTYKGKRITALSHGIGTDNIDIVLNELDALANIDFATRTIRPTFRQLTLVRIGTSGGLQPFTPIGTYVAAEKSIGFDGVLYFYADSERVRDMAFETELQKQLDWKLNRLLPYVVPADASLIEQITGNDILRGVTIAANGFYGPQGRRLRLPLADPELNKKIGQFNYNGQQITNYEMESSSLAGLAALMGHRAMTVCCIIAGRVAQNMNTEYKGSMPGLIQTVLERI